MSLKKFDLNLANRLNYPLSGGRLQWKPASVTVDGKKITELKPDTTVTPELLAKLTDKMKKDERFGTKGAAAFREAFQRAKSKNGDKDPTLRQMRAQIDTATNSLANERAKGRINDGYIDSREAHAIKNPLAGAIFEWLLGVAQTPQPSKKDLELSATTAQLDQALENLEKAVDAAFKKFKRGGSYGDLVGAIREACKEQKLPETARSAIMIGMNGKTGRGDNGTLESTPSIAEVKQALRNAVSKLKNADGAAIVDFKHPERAPKSKKDGIITGLEVDRTPSVTGQAAHAVLRYASSLGGARKA